MQQENNEKICIEHKDKVLTIHDYYDGFLLGIATFNGQECIYESDYLENGNPTLYYLTPIDSEQLLSIMFEWERLIDWHSEKRSEQCWNKEKRFDLKAIARQSENYKQYVRHASFHGSYKNFHSHIDSLFVEWSE